MSVKHNTDILCQVCVAQFITTYKTLVGWCLMFQHKKATSCHAKIKSLLKIFISGTGR